MAKQMGFFGNSKPDLSIKVNTYIPKNPQCVSCGLHRYCKSPKMPYSGKGKLQVLVCGEAPGCVSGDTLIDTAFRNKSKHPKGIPIKELVGKKNLHVYSFDIQKQKLVVGKVKRVWETGVKETFKVTYQWHNGNNELIENSLIVTANHKFLLKGNSIPHDPYKGINKNKKCKYLSINDGLDVGYALQPFHRYNNKYSYIRIGKEKVKESRFLLEHKIGTKLKEKEQCHHKDFNKWNDVSDNLKLTTLKEHSRYHTSINNPMSNPVHKKTHKKALASKLYRKQQSILLKKALKKDKALYNARKKQVIQAGLKTRFKKGESTLMTPKRYYKHLLGCMKRWGWKLKDVEIRFKNKFPNEKFPPIDNHIIVSIEPMGKIQVYDMEIEEYHNFVANGVIIHNSEEDDLNTQWVGQVGKKFKADLLKEGFDLNEDAWKINALSCFPGYRHGSIATPTNDQVAFCRRNVLNVIEELKPRFIWLVGSKAIRSLLGEHFGKDLSPGRWRGWKCWDERWGCWVLPMYHPSYVARQEKDLLLKSVYERDLKEAVKFVHSAGKPHFEEDIRCLTDFGEVTELLKDIKKNKPYIAFDYEATGLKPQARGHRIVSISVCFDETISYSFPLSYQDFWTQWELKKIKSLWVSILEDEKIQKCAQNIQFEHLWTHFILKAEVRGWDFDTMLAGHVLDSRAKVCNLDFMSYVHFGVLPYDREIASYKKGKKGGFNRMNEAPLTPLLLYGGKDSLYTFRLSKVLPDLLDKEEVLWQGYDLLHEGTLEFAEMQKEGILVDENYYVETDRELTERVKGLKEELNRGKDAEEFKKKFGRPIDINSNKDIGKLLYEVLGLPENLTSKGNYKVDKETLGDVGSGFARDLLDYRRLEKVRGTYLAQFKREVVDGKIYPMFGLSIPVTYRGQSQAPNFQNIPVRDEEAKKLTRSGIIAPPGYVIMEFDYSGVEVATSCCHHKDPNMIKYVSDPSTDMHRDVAMDIWLLPKKQMTPEIRFYGKNGWTFPQFYGDYYGSCARVLWKTCLGLKTKDGRTLKEHLKNVVWVNEDGKNVTGITKYWQFEEHCKEVERIFWRERFYHYDEWKKEQAKFFIKHGYIETLTGFRCRGTLNKKDVSNHGIQGDAFHILLMTLIESRKEIKKRGLGARIFGQIHDSGLLYVPVEEVRETMKVVNEIGTKKILKIYPWINVPLKIDFEVTPEGGNWSQKKDIEIGE